MTSKKNNLRFFTPKITSEKGSILIDVGISAGFPSPADDFRETRISLDAELLPTKKLLFLREFVVNQ